MSFVKPRTREVVAIPNVGPNDGRSIMTKDQFLEFDPNQLPGTTGVIPMRPEIVGKRSAGRHAADDRRIRSHHGDMMDPRVFFGCDAGMTTWETLEMMAKALRGNLGERDRQRVDKGSTVARADGPDGRWYCHQQRFQNDNGPVSWATTFVSPRAGFNAVAYVHTEGGPDGRVLAKLEWDWTVVAGIYVPSRIKESHNYAEKDHLGTHRESMLENCTLNQPLDPHQFDHRALGMVDGELIIDHVKRVVYVIKNGEPVKLEDFPIPRR
jgi:hypothetical protein